MQIVVLTPSPLGKNPVEAEMSSRPGKEELPLPDRKAAAMVERVKFNLERGIYIVGFFLQRRSCRSCEMRAY